MIDIASSVAILAMVDKLWEHGSWTGETHVQKAMFFLDKKYAKSTGFDFVLYKHGPYSFDLHDSLADLFSTCLIEHQIQPPYGPRIRLTDSGKKFLAEHGDRLAAVQPSLNTVAEWFGSSGVSELEKRATALWVSVASPEAEEETLAEQVHAIKPHIPVDDALQAVRAVASMPS